MLRRGVCVAVILAVLSLGVQPATAEPLCLQYNSFGVCILYAEDGGSGGSDEVPVSEGGSVDQVCKFGESEVPCVTDEGVWLPTRSCYVLKLDPQPPKGDPSWHGHDTGAVYECRNRYAKPPHSIDPVPDFQFIWLDSSPLALDPQVLAQRAVDSMGLEAIKIGLPVPKDDKHMIYVGAPLWMWVANPGRETTGPNEASATAGAVTVSVKARLKSVEWKMGEGRSVFCRGEHRAKGTVYKPAFGMTDSPTCGYRYQHPHKEVGIEAISHWSIDWKGAGQDGTITMDLTRRTTRPVGEIQVLIKTH